MDRLSLVRIRPRDTVLGEAGLVALGDGGICKSPVTVPYRDRGVTAAEYGEARPRSA
jgi:hypothetical protein